MSPRPAALILRASTSQGQELPEHLRRTLFKVRESIDKRAGGTGSPVPVPGGQVRYDGLNIELPTEEWDPVKKAAAQNARGQVRKAIRRLEKNTKKSHSNQTQAQTEKPNQNTRYKNRLIDPLPPPDPAAAG